MRAAAVQSTTQHRGEKSVTYPVVSLNVRPGEYCVIYALHERLVVISELVFVGSVSHVECLW